MEQLIYTSAPRLLDAGKSGFGTIARGRDIPRALVNYLERISTFDRAAGVDSLLYYTVFSAAGLRFHIFSRVQDCGADYTGRTNHVAHHFIAEEGSAEYAALSGGTPAGTMLALQAQWCKRWDEAPRWLEPTPLSASLPKGEKFAWTRMTDNQENAGWLCTEEYHQGATLVFDCEISAEQALGLLHDAYLRRPDHGWGTGFCTARVTNISSSATPYICLDARQAEAGISPSAGSRRLSVRAPMAPPPPSVFRATEKESIPEQESAAPASGGIVVEEIKGDDPSPVVSSSPQTSASVHSPFGTPVQPDPRPFIPGQPSKRHRANTPNKAIGVFALLLIGVVALFWKISSDKEQTLQMAKEYAAQVEAAVDLYKDAECPLAKKEFEKVSPEALKEAVVQQDAAQCEKHRIELEACWTRFIDALVREGNQKVQELKKYNLSHFEEDMKKSADAVSAAKKDIRLCKDKLAEYCKKLRQAKDAVAMLDKLSKIEPVSDDLASKEEAQKYIERDWYKLEKGKQHDKFVAFEKRRKESRDKLQAELDQFKPFEKFEKKALTTAYKDEIGTNIKENQLETAQKKIKDSQKEWIDKRDELLGRAKPHEAKQEKKVKILVKALRECKYVNKEAYNKLKDALDGLEKALKEAQAKSENTPTPDANASRGEASQEPATPPDKTGQATEEQAKPANVSFKAKSITVWVWTNVEGTKVPEKVEGTDAEIVRKKLADLGDKIVRDKQVFLTATFPDRFRQFLLKQNPKSGEIEDPTVYIKVAPLKDEKIYEGIKGTPLEDGKIYEGIKGWKFDNYEALEKNINDCIQIKIYDISSDNAALDVKLIWKEPQFKSEQEVKKKEDEWGRNKAKADKKLKAKEKEPEEAAKPEQKAQPGAPQGAPNDRNKTKKGSTKKDKNK